MSITNGKFTPQKGEKTKKCFRVFAFFGRELHFSLNIIMMNIIWTNNTYLYILKMFQIKSLTFFAVSERSRWKNFIGVKSEENRPIDSFLTNKNNKLSFVKLSLLSPSLYLFMVKVISCLIKIYQITWSINLLILWFKKRIEMIWRT